MKIAPAMLAVAAATGAWTETLVVVHVEGRTVPASAYVDEAPRGIEAASRAAAAVARLPDGGRPEMPNFYPVGAGPLQAAPGEDAVRRPVAAAVFVVGPGQEEWIAGMAPRLRRAGAAGIAVGVRDATEFERLRETAAREGLAIAPVDGASVADALGIWRYPVLVEPAR